MAADDPVPEADAQEQSIPVDDSVVPPEVPVIPPDVPEADALEQAQQVRDRAPVPPQIRADVPEADALEQSVPAGHEDEEE